VPKETRTCRFCNADFETYKGNAQVFCGPECGTGLVSHTCQHCGCTFEATRRKPRVYCGKKCISASRARRVREQNATKTCSIDGCSNPAKYMKRRICATHASRLIRTGQFAYRRIDKRGFIQLKEPNHPAAGPKGWADDHRKVFADANGIDGHSCYWCGGPTTWPDLVVHHLNLSKFDNRSENLVASCVQCDRSRSSLSSFLRSLTSTGLTRFIGSIPLVRQVPDSGEID
jgi:hypothetical protein